MDQQPTIHPIRAARQKRHLSQAALGKLVGVQKSAVSKWESGANFPEPDIGKRVAKALSIPFESVYASAAA